MKGRDTLCKGAILKLIFAKLCLKELTGLNWLIFGTGEWVYEHSNEASITAMSFLIAPVNGTF
jgi:hypothetical protein